jgi:hypothetical protein
MSASVLLIEALGGGWDASTLPTVHEVAQGKPPALDHKKTTD